MAFKFAGDHREFCSNERVDCRHCGEKRRRADMEAHLVNECRKLEVPCDFAYLGCSFWDQRSRMELHYTNRRFRKQHVEMLQMKISNSLDAK